ncbi:mCG121677, isoform CRA_a, partial [Mus musculus]
GPAPISGATRWRKTRKCTPGSLPRGDGSGTRRPAVVPDERCGRVGGVPGQTGVQVSQYSVKPANQKKDCLSFEDVAVYFSWEE